MPYSVLLCILQAFTNTSWPLFYLCWQIWLCITLIPFIFPFTVPLFFSTFPFRGDTFNPVLQCLIHFILEYGQVYYIITCSILSCSAPSSSRHMYHGLIYLDIFASYFNQKVKSNTPLTFLNFLYSVGLKIILCFLKYPILPQKPIPALHKAFLLYSGKSIFGNLSFKNIQL